jgi:VanZ family protein
MLPDPKIPGLDKIVHFCIFLAWTVAIVHDFNLKWFTALAAVVVFAVITEVIQLGVEGRTFDLMDLLADIAGAVFGLANSGFIIRITKKVLRR